MLRHLFLGAVSVLAFSNHAAAQSFTLPEIGIQSSGACRQLGVRDRSNAAMVPLGCLEPGTGAFAFQGSASTMTRRRPGGFARSLAEASGDEVNVRDLVAGTCTGNAAIDTAAMNAALSIASASPGRTIRLPACTWAFQVPANTIGFKVPNATKVKGDGPQTLITWNDDAGNTLFGSTSAGAVRSSDIVFEDFRVRGTLDTRGYAGAYPFLPTQVDGLTFRNVVSEYSRIMGMTARGSTDVNAIGSTIRFTGSDGINFAQCTNVAVRDNDILHTNDDAIGVHSDIYDPWKVRGSLVISGNRTFDTQGIRALAARQTSIAGNVVTNVRQHGISVETLAAVGSGFQEGAASAQAITIADNVVTNIIDRTLVDNFNQGAYGLMISGASARAGTAGAVPGEPNKATGKVASPYAEFFANSSAASLPTPGTRGIIVSGNIFARTLPASDGTDPRFTKWSDFGQGKIWTEKGWVDPSLPVNSLRAVGVLISGGVVRDVTMTGNHFSGLGSALAMGAGDRFDNIVFRGNQVVDADFGLIVNTNAKMRLYFDNNIIDLDPYLQASNRGTSGTWATGGAPMAVFQNSGSGVFMRGNTFRNMAQIFNQGFGLTGFYWAENMVEADATTFDAFSTTSKGVGNVPANRPSFRYVRVGSDPANDNFGAVLAMPAYP